jgi:mannose-6-phosphate isomerase-like protein (cupin superfamily)
MRGPYRRGRLLEPAAAPATGERFEVLASLAGTTVEQILSGRLERPGEYLQDHDEWVVLLAGRARLEVAGEPVELAAGDWLLLPAGVPHAVLETEPGSSWLAVHSGGG